MQLAFVAALSAFVLVSPARSATPDPVQSTYTFQGNCTICDSPNSPAIATLVLQNYTPGTALSSANLVNLFYLSSQTILDLQSGDLSGTLGATPGAYDVSFSQIFDFGFDRQVTTFDTDAAGHWAANPPYTEGFDIDGGKQGVWTLVGAPTEGAVPEAASWMTMIAGLGMIGGVMRKGRRAIVRFG